MQLQQQQQKAAG